MKPKQRTVVVLLCIAALFPGCRGTVYNVTEVPGELLASPITNMDTIDWAALSDSVASSQTIYPGDTLRVTAATGLSEENGESWTVRVDDSGVAAIPVIGRVQLAGLDFSQAGAEVRRASMERQIYRNPSVVVALEERKTQEITVIGAVGSPGTYKLPAAGCDLAAALIAAGGISDDADRIVEIRQPQPGQTGAHFASYNGENSPPPQAEQPPVVIDLLAATQPGVALPRLRDGSVVRVVPRPERVAHITGVIKNTKVSLPHNRDVRLLEVLASAGGPRYSNWISDDLTIIRQVPNTNETVKIDASINRAKRDETANLVIKDGDIVNVDENALTFTLSTVQGLIGVGLSAARLAP